MADSATNIPPTTAAANNAGNSRAASYAHGLLQISVPVHVTLAAQRTSVQEIIELGPGSIVKFEKTCDQPLEVAIGGRTIAEGEVVKVGDKFGVRIRGLVK
jgi:flagellar motor switch protein FliN/FliY